MARAAGFVVSTIGMLVTLCAIGSVNGGVYEFAGRCVPMLQTRLDAIFYALWTRWNMCDSAAVELWVGQGGQRILCPPVLPVGIRCIHYALQLGLLLGPAAYLGLAVFDACRSVKKRNASDLRGLESAVYHGTSRAGNAAVLKRTSCRTGLLCRPRVTASATFVFLVLVFLVGDAVVCGREVFDASVVFVHLGDPSGLAEALASVVRQLFDGALALLVPWVVVVLLYAQARRNGNAFARSCEGCGYNLTGNVSGICPECGTPVPPGAAPPARPVDGPEQASRE